MHSEQRPAGSYRAHTEQRISGGEKKEKKKGTPLISQLFKIYIVKLQLQMGLFHSMHGRRLVFVFQGKKAKASLADMHIRTYIHTSRYKKSFYSLSQAYGLSLSSSAAAAASVFFLPFLSLRPCRTIQQSPYSVCITCI